MASTPTPVTDRLRRAATRISAWQRTPWGRRLTRGTKWAVTAGIIGFLVYQLSQVGWVEVWRARPTSPLFYLVYVLLFATLPVTEVIIYQRLWGAGRLVTLFASLRKRALNVDVAGYSGEVYLYLWAKDRVDHSRSYIAQVIKDNIILSSLASIATAALLIVLLLATGQVALGDWLDNPDPWYIGGGLAAAVLVASLLIQFRRVVFSLPDHLVAWVGSVHTVRYIVLYTLQVALWWSALPEVPFQGWATLLVVLVLLERVPFLPSKDLLFVGVGMELYAVVGVPQAALASVLLAQGVLNKILNALFFISTLLYERQVVEQVTEESSPLFSTTESAASDREKP